MRHYIRIMLHYLIKTRLSLHYISFSFFFFYHMYVLGVSSSVDVSLQWYHVFLLFIIALYFFYVSLHCKLSCVIIFPSCYIIWSKHAYYMSVVSLVNFLFLPWCLLSIFFFFSFPSMVSVVNFLFFSFPSMVSLVNFFFLFLPWCLFSIFFSFYAACC